MAGLLNALSGLLGGSSAPVAKAQPRGYKSYLRISDGDAAFDTAAEVFALVGAAGIWTKIWEKTVSPQQLMRWGFGSPNQPYNQGYMYFFLEDAGTGFDVGTIRLQQARARDRDPKIVAEIDDTRLHTATNTSAATARPTSINDMIALPEKVEFPFVGEDSKLQIWYKLATATTAVDVAEFSIPVTIYEI